MVANSYQNERAFSAKKAHKINFFRTKPTQTDWDRSNPTKAIFKLELSALTLPETSSLNQKNMRQNSIVFWEKYHEEKYHNEKHHEDKHHEDKYHKDKYHEEKRIKRRNSGHPCPVAETFTSSFDAEKERLHFMKLYPFMRYRLLQLRPSKGKNKSIPTMHCKQELEIHWRLKPWTQKRKEVLLSITYIKNRVFN